MITQTDLQDRGSAVIFPDPNLAFQMNADPDPEDLFQ